MNAKTNDNTRFPEMFLIFVENKHPLSGETYDTIERKILEMKVKDPKKRASHKIKILASWLRTEQDYMDLVGDGCPAEIAREVLSIGTKAEIVIQANVREWRHIFSQRTPITAHPRMREVMRPLLAEFRELMPVIFDDVGLAES